MDEILVNINNLLCIFKEIFYKLLCRPTKLDFLTDEIKTINYKVIIDK